MSNEWYTPQAIKTPDGKQIKEKVWKQLQNLYCKNYEKPPNENHRWIFRGEPKFNEKEEEKYLCTSLERAFDNYGICDEEKKVENEKKIIRKFQRNVSLYIEGGEPDKDDILEWLALMRHHGAPVRLMDWVYSYYIAIYFGLAENIKGVIWAINTAKTSEPKFVINRIPKGKGARFWELRHKLGSKNDILGIREKGDKLDDLAITCYLMENPLPLVYPVNPFRLNKRLTIQNGLFLLTGDIRKSFKENLKACFDKNDIHKITVECNKNEKNEILWNLKNMNITNEVLFPGLDGFAKSTGELLAYSEKLRFNT